VASQCSINYRPSRIFSLPSNYNTNELNWGLSLQTSQGFWSDIDARYWDGSDEKNVSGVVGVMGEGGLQNCERI